MAGMSVSGKTFSFSDLRILGRLLGGGALTMCKSHVVAFSLEQCSSSLSLTNKRPLGTARRKKDLLPGIFMSELYLTTKSKRPPPPGTLSFWQLSARAAAPIKQQEHVPLVPLVLHIVKAGLCRRPLHAGDLGPALLLPQVRREDHSFKAEGLQV